METPQTLLKRSWNTPMLQLLQYQKKKRLQTHTQKLLYQKCLFPTILADHKFFWRTDFLTKIFLPKNSFNKSLSTKIYFWPKISLTKLFFTRNFFDQKLFLSEISLPTFCAPKSCWPTKHFFLEISLTKFPWTKWWILLVLLRLKLI